MENTEIIYECDSLNNKRVRANELKILRKNETGLYFEFGESEKNIKQRFYRSLDVLNKDYNELKKIKEKMEKGSKKTSEESVEAEEEKKENSKSSYKKDIF